MKVIPEEEAASQRRNNQCDVFAILQGIANMGRNESEK
jgi:hypothetical protein